MKLPIFRYRASGSLGLKRAFRRVDLGLACTIPVTKRFRNKQQEYRVGLLRIFFTVRGTEQG